MGEPQGQSSPSPLFPRFLKTSCIDDLQSRVHVNQVPDPHICLRGSPLKLRLTADLEVHSKDKDTQRKNGNNKFVR